MPHRSGPSCRSARPGWVARAGPVGQDGRERRRGPCYPALPLPVAVDAEGRVDLLRGLPNLTLWRAWPDSRPATLGRLTHELFTRHSTEHISVSRPGVTKGAIAFTAVAVGAADISGPIRRALRWRSPRRAPWSRRGSEASSVEAERERVVDGARPGARVSNGRCRRPESLDEDGGFSRQRSGAGDSARPLRGPARCVTVAAP